MVQYTNDDKEVVKAFMQCQTLKSYRCKSDGQSFYSGELRVAEHVPNGDGTASTLVYDFTDRGGFFIDKQVQCHVIQLKRSAPIHVSYSHLSLTTNSIGESHVRC